MKGLLGKATTGEPGHNEPTDRHKQLTIRVSTAGIIMLCLSGHSGAATFDPNWMSNFSVLTFMDARTDDLPNSSSGWTIDPGADVFEQELYERPTGQSHSLDNGDLVFDKYYQPLDIISGQFANDTINDHAYFSINLVGQNVIDQSGSSSLTGFKHFYRVRIGDNADFAGGYMFGVKDPNGNSTGAFDKKATQSWIDNPGNGFVTGPGGLTAVNEGTLGYDELTSEGVSDSINARIIGNSVEIAVDYGALGIGESLFTNLLFEATQGLTDPQNYFWNDEYSLAQAGSPYDIGNPPQNVYELDTVKGVGITPIPIPAAAWLLGSGLGLFGLVNRVRLRRKQQP